MCGWRRLARTRRRRGWRMSPGSWWSLRGEVPASEPGEQLAPYPALVTVGYRAGSSWLVDLERMGVVRVVGPPEIADDVARCMAAELALNTWSDQVRVVAAGLGDEVARLDPQRCVVVEDVAAVASALAADARDAAAGPDALTRRVHTHGDAWLPQVIVAGSAVPGDAVAEAVAAITGAGGARVAVAVVVSTNADQSTEDTGAWDVLIGPDGSIRVPQLGLTATAQTLSRDAAAGVATLLEAVRGGQDAPAAGWDDPGPRWQRYATRDGGLRAELREPRDPDAAVQAAEPAAQDAGSREAAQHRQETVVDVRDAAPSSATQAATDVPDLTSVLPAAGTEYAAAGATRPEDVAAVAPWVTAQVRGAVEDADPDLDDDVDAWCSDEQDRPRITVLGPITVRAKGPQPARVQFHSEVAAYLAARENGATVAELADAFGVTAPKARDAAAALRTWLGRSSTGNCGYRTRPPPRPRGPVGSGCTRSGERW